MKELFLPRTFPGVSCVQYSVSLLRKIWSHFLAALYHSSGEKEPSKGTTPLSSLFQRTLCIRPCGSLCSSTGYRLSGAILIPRLPLACQGSLTWLKTSNAAGSSLRKISAVRNPSTSNERPPSSAPVG